MLAVISHGMSSRMSTLGNKAWQSSNLLWTSIRLVRSLAGVHRKPTVSQPYGTRSWIPIIWISHTSYFCSCTQVSGSSHVRNSIDSCQEKIVLTDRRSSKSSDQALLHKKSQRAPKGCSVCPSATVYVACGPGSTYSSP